MHSHDTEGFASCCKPQLLCPFLTLQQDVRKVSLYILGYICIFLKLLFYSKSNGVIFNLVGQRNHKLWPYNYMRVILIAIGMHTKPCIASLVFTACNYESRCNADLILLQKKAFNAQNVMVQ